MSASLQVSESLNHWNDLVPDLKQLKRIWQWIR
jgi:hypothetical protein